MKKVTSFRLDDDMLDKINFITDMLAVESGKYYHRSEIIRAGLRGFFEEVLAADSKEEIIQRLDDLLKDT